MVQSHPRRWLRFLCAAVAAVLALPPAIPVHAEEAASTVLINEIESNDPDGGSDWVEIINVGTEDADISGWFLTDDAGLERVSEGTAKPIAAGTVLAPGAVLVLEEGIDFDFGLGKKDAVTLYNSDSQVMDTYAWTSHANGTYSRIPGTSEFADQAPTRGAANVTGSGGGDEPDPSDPPKDPEPPVSYPIVINEVESNGDETDWVEIYNTGAEPVDISRWYLLDNDPEGHAADVTPVPEGTVLQPGSWFVFEQGIHFTFGLGGNDQVTIFDADGNTVAEFSWTEHAQVVYARVPDGTGALEEFGTSTKGAANKAAAHVHDYQSVTTAPTCTEKGYTTHTCSCGDSYVDTYTDPTGHSYTAVVTEPTCGEKGFTTHTCSVCGDHYEDTYTDATGEHVYENDQDTTCDVCGFSRVISVPMYRLYNPYTQEHLLTGSADEKDALVKAGWSLDGVAWNSPSEGTPVYRLYNPYDDWHTYSVSQEEIDTLVPLGWKVDGVVCRSADENDGTPIFRLFNPYEQKNYHLLTASTQERDSLTELGWKFEGVAWYALDK